MIVGLIVMIGLFVMRFSSTPVAFPSTVALPDGKTPVAFTQTANWYAVVTSEDEIMIFDRATDRHIQTIQIEK